MLYLLNVEFDLLYITQHYCPIKNRTLFSLSFCLDTKERKNQFSIEDVRRKYSALTFLASLLLRGVSFFVKKKRKANRIIFQIEIVVRIMNLNRVLIVTLKEQT